jgi:phosphatidylinositol dimannoside acyltransferase
VKVPDPVTGAYRLGSVVAQTIPAPWVHGAADLAGTLAAQVMRGRRDMVARHQRRVRPELSGRALDRAVDATFDSYARYWVESFRLPSQSPVELDVAFSYEGYDHVVAAREQGSGVIIALPHLGGWEWAAFWIAQIEHTPLTAVVEAVDPPELFEWFVEFRRSLGMNVVPLGPKAGAEALQAVRNGDILCLLCDRDIGGGGVEVEFFGERTTLPPGPAMLALRTGAPLLPTAIYFDGDGHRAVVEPPLDTTRSAAGLRADVARVTQELAHALERLIRAAPEQWHLLQPNWPSDYEQG